MHERLGALSTASKYEKGIEVNFLGEKLKKMLLQPDSGLRHVNAMYPRCD